MDLGALAGRDKADELDAHRSSLYGWEAVRTRASACSSRGNSDAPHQGTMPRTDQAVAVSERRPPGRPERYASLTEARNRSRCDAGKPVTWTPTGPWPPSSGSQ